jgi:hypothetical protein
MRVLLKPKLLGLIVVFLASLAWLRDSSVQFAIGIGERLAEALNLISGAVSGVSAVELRRGREILWTMGTRGRFLLRTDPEDRPGGRTDSLRRGIDRKASFLVG